jgi:hypothetical protein
VPLEPVRRLAAAAQRRFAAASRPGGDKPAGPRTFREMGPTLKHASAALREAGVPHALTGAPACWVHGGPEFGIDWDLVVPPGDVDAAAAALAGAGMRVERPPEGWLIKAWDGDVLVDVIFDPLGAPVDECLARARVERVLGMPVPVLDPTDVAISMLLSRSAAFLEFERLLAALRPIRERIDWDRVRSATAGSPYAVGFLTMVEALGIAPAAAASASPAQPALRRA